MGCFDAVAAAQLLISQLIAHVHESHGQRLIWIPLYIYFPKHRE